MCGSSPPQQDPAAVAAAQGAANRETAIAQGFVNNPNINNPYGNQTVTWQQLPGTDQWQATVNQNLAPAQQQMLDYQNQMGTQLGQMGVNQLQAVRGIQNSQLPYYDLSTPINPIAGSAGVNPNYQTYAGNPLAADQTFNALMGSSTGQIYSPYGQMANSARNMSNFAPQQQSYASMPQQSYSPANQAGQIQSSGLPVPQQSYSPANRPGGLMSSIGSTAQSNSTAPAAQTTAPAGGIPSWLANNPQAMSNINQFASQNNISPETAYQWSSGRANPSAPPNYTLGAMYGSGPGYGPFSDSPQKTGITPPPRPPVPTASPANSAAQSNAPYPQSSQGQLYGMLPPPASKQQAGQSPYTMGLASNYSPPAPAAPNLPNSIVGAQGSFMPLSSDTLAANTLGGVANPFGSAGSVPKIGDIQSQAATNNMALNPDALFGNVVSGAGVVDPLKKVTSSIAPTTGQMQTSLGTTPLNIDAEYQNVVNGAGPVAGLSPIQGQINTQGIQPIPTVDAAARQHAEDIAYQAAASRLDPQWQQAQAQKETELRNQGLVPGGEAYNNAMRVFGQQKNDAYQQAQALAVQQGLTNQQAQFGMGLSANQAGFGNAQNLGQFANQAQAQGLGQNLSLANLYNQGQQQNYNQQLGAGQFANQAVGQQFGQNLSAANLQNAAAAQQYGMNTGLGNFYAQTQNQGFNQGQANVNLANQAQQQQYAQNMGYGNAYADWQNQAFQQSQQNLAAANQAQAQQYAQNLGLANTYAQLQGQQFGQQQQNAALNNAVGQQLFQQGLANANLNNQASQQQIQTYLTARQLPLNELNAFRTGSQVSIPQFQQFTGGGQQQAPNMAQLAMNNQNAQVSSQNAFTSGLASLAGLGLYGLFSDRRLKSKLKRIGTHKLGFGIFEYDIFGHRTKGVMADDVERVMPKAVRIGGGGYKMVNYAMIGGVYA